MVGGCEGETYKVHLCLEDKVLPSVCGRRLVCMCVCVCKKERKRERKRECAREIGSEKV
jgi:hypothetical protein